MAVSRVRSQVEVFISGRMKSFLTDLLVQLAVLSLCVNSSKLYFLHMERLVIFNGTLTSCCARLRDQRDLGVPASKSHDHKQRLCHQEPVLDVWCCLTPQNIWETSYVSWQMFSQLFWISLLVQSLIKKI